VSDQVEPVDLHGPARAGKAEKAKRRKVTEDNDAADLMWLMGSERGRRIVWRLLERAEVFRSEFTANALQEAFNKGKRDFGLWALGEIAMASPDGYHLMLKERADVRSSSADASRKQN
jgi:hypothetical protein